MSNAVDVIKYMNFCGLCTTGSCDKCDRKKAKEAAITAIEQLEKLQISLASMEAEADFCHSLSSSFADVGFNDESRMMLLKEEVFRDCIGMIKEDLGMV